MIVILQIFFVLLLIIVIIYVVYKPGRREKKIIPLTDADREALNNHVIFYRKLDAKAKKEFEEKLEKFLAEIKITGINAGVEQLDRLLIGAGAVIPVFSFRDWEYTNLHEVLLYPGIFNEDFDQDGYYRSISGMVGSGAMQHVMIISKNDLHGSFINNHSTRNTAIHEFVHLIDKMDGTMDGVPEILLERKYIGHWVNLMNHAIMQIRNENSDIDPYGATNTTEFFAVVSEYFFQQPEMLYINHPQLYAMLDRIFIRR